MESNSEGGDTELSRLKHSFTLTLSVDYQMSRLVPHWGHSPQPGSTYYLQKLSIDLFGLVDHRDETAHIYLFNETVGPENTDHTCSYFTHYLKESGNLPPWIRRVHIFLDKCRKYQQNYYFMSAAMELVQHQVVDYIRVSFMIAGHTKFAPDRLLSKVAKAYYCSYVFTIQELSIIAAEYSQVTIDEGNIVRTWREEAEKKYSKLSGIISLHDFLIVRHPTTNNAMMKVREQCYTGLFEVSTLKVYKRCASTDRAIPSNEDLYKARDKVKNISSTKAANLQQMYLKFVPEGRRPDYLT